jgi:hypothetical protein
MVVGFVPGSGADFTRERNERNRFDDFVKLKQSTTARVEGLVAVSVRSSWLSLESRGLSVSAIEKLARFSNYERI